LFVGSADEEYTDDDEEWREIDFVIHDPPIAKLLLLLLLLLLLVKLGICFRGNECSPVDDGGGGG
jgi:hypothetical protein